MWFFDPLYLIIAAPALLLSVGAQMWVKAAFAQYGRVPNRRGITGAEAARRVLQAAGLTAVRIEQSRGFLSDHYDPRSKVLRLSPDVYGQSTLAAVGVAAHEAGHALQDARGYQAMQLRSALVPVASIGSNLAMPILIFGFLLQAAALVKVGVILFAAVVAFQLVTLPVEFNASSRALKALGGVGVLAADELPGARKVLTAAAMTYVAAAVAAIGQLVYFLLRSGMLGGSDE
jgi:Zn-dependent membrane protease YugP